VSLTVNAVEGRRFDVMLVPYTLDHTTFGRMPAGSRVNLEVDILAKYVASLMGKPGVDGPEH
jgi:riboflavin synthase